MTPMKMIMMGLAAIAAVVTISLSSMLLETNDAGYVQVKQSYGSGTMTAGSEATDRCAV